ncbi:MAG: alcohol dehydrogenase catalytic domain-containing protein, partial [Rhodobacter sp.]|nr:alcohol dehydrogenase catalytic domain-containing protein [Rhodobacter sp.]
MRALQISTFGLPPDLRTVPVPDPGPGEVLLRTAACGLNFADLLMCEGRYQETPPLPFTLGMEVAGTVEACGPGVTGFAQGDRVAAVPGSGGLADLVAVPAARCVAIPPGMSFVQAASFQIAYGTSHLALDHRARLRPGETLLVLGAAGGVGLTAVEIGKHMGARVIACARG